jgi:hypothetical protein
MPSSISSSEPLRVVPDVPWPRTAMLAVSLFLVALAGWETYWRFEWLVPSYRNSDGLWALTRDRIDDEGPGGTAIVGSSRVLFDLNLEAWREETGILPIQLALEGTNPRPYLTHLAQQTSFAGLVVVGVTEVLFFSPTPGLRADVIARYRDRTPADRVAQQLSMHLVEPYFAFYDPDVALFTVLRRQPFWPARRDLAPQLPTVRKLSNSRRTRQADMWNKVELHPGYREVARGTWLTFLNAPRPAPPPPEVMQQQADALLAEVAADVRAIRARGGDVVFVRAPSIGPFREAELKAFPRERAWDPLLARAEAAGVHFEDYPDLQDVELPEWSHIRAGETDRFTRALVRHLRAALAARGTPRPELGR